MPPKKILLHFRDDTQGGISAASLELLNPAEEALVDKLMKGVAVAKSISYCG